MMDRDTKDSPSSDTLWTVMDVARFLKLSRAKVYTLPLRYTKIGKARRYDPADVRLYIDLHASRPALRRPA